MNVWGNKLQVGDEVDTFFNPRGSHSRVISINDSTSILPTPCKSVTFTSSSKSGTTTMSVFNTDWFTLRNKGKRNG